MTKTKFIVLFAITWIFSYVSIPIKFASLSTNVGADETLKVVAIILAVIYTGMSFITYKWGQKTNKVLLVSFPIIAGFFEVLNIPILPSILCLITLIIGAIISAPTAGSGADAP
jgi:hypothetical protein